jgi:hypothetical protein
LNGIVISAVFFVLLDGAGERYQITYSPVHVDGVLQGGHYSTVHESTIVTCTGGSGVGNGEVLRAIIEYKEDVAIGFRLFAVTVHFMNRCCCPSVRSTYGHLSFH